MLTRNAMLTHNQTEDRPNYLIEAVSVTVIAICIAINVFGSNLGFTTLDSRPADGFEGFKMVNVSHHHHQDQAN